MNRVLTYLSLIFTTSLTSLTIHAATYGKVLLISDIDDTIKVSHILGPIAEKLARGGNITTPFTGMPQLYQLILNSFSPKVTNENTSARVVYLSNAPEQVFGIPALLTSHQNFVRYNKFPAGDSHLRP